nr:hypothetical protein [Tanacetum cinerariifolium]
MKTPLPVAQSSSQAQSSLKAAESLSEYELKTILFDKMDKSRFYLTHDKHQALFDVLLNSILLDDVVARGQADPEKVLRKIYCDNEDPSAGPNQGKKTKRSRTKESEPSKKSSTLKETCKGKSLAKTSISSKSVTAHELVEEPVVEMASNVIEQTVDDVVNDVDQPHDDSTQTKGKDPKQYWFKQPPRPPTPNPKWNKRQVYAMNRIKIDNLTQAHLLGLVYELLKGTCTSIIKLEYNMEEYFKTLTDKLDWNNPEGDHCPFDLIKPLSLKGRPGRLAVAAEYFFNNDLEFLKSSYPKKKYTTSITKTKAACVSVKKLHGYGHLEEIAARRADRHVYKFKEDDFVDLHMNDIKDMLLFTVQHKLFQLDGNDIVNLIVALRMFTRSLIIKRQIKDLQLYVESYQKKLNFSEPQKTFPKTNQRTLHSIIQTTRDARKTHHKESGKIGGCSETQDGLQTDDTN